MTANSPHGAVVQKAVEQSLECSLSDDERRMFGATLDEVKARAAAELLDDLDAYAQRDPASRGKARVILETYASFRAVIGHRLAHAVWNFCRNSGPCCELLAHRLSNAGKVMSGIDIHPAARIGRRFVVDHGFGTVIGETSVIGDDCYILSGVILGAVGIANNGNGPRHPRIGNRVEIGAAARVLGPIEVGDDAFIGPSCVVTQNVPPGAKTTIINQVQITKDAALGSMGYVGAFIVNDVLHLVGEAVDELALEMVDVHHRPVPNQRWKRISTSLHHAEYRLTLSSVSTVPKPSAVHLRVTNCQRNQTVTILSPPGLIGMLSTAFNEKIMTFTR